MKSEEAPTYRRDQKPVNDTGFPALPAAPCRFPVSKQRPRTYTLNLTTQYSQVEIGGVGEVPLRLLV